MNHSVVWTHIPGPRRGPLWALSTHLSSLHGTSHTWHRKCYSIIHREQEHFIKELFKGGQGQEGGSFPKVKQDEGGILTTSPGQVGELRTWGIRWFSQSSALLSLRSFDIQSTVYVLEKETGAVCFVCAFVFVSVGAQPTYSVFRAEKMCFLIKRSAWFSVVLRERQTYKERGRAGMK